MEDFLTIHLLCGVGVYLWADVSPAGRSQAAHRLTSAEEALEVVEIELLLPLQLVGRRAGLRLRHTNECLTRSLPVVCM